MQEVVARIGMTAVVVILDGELVPLEVLDHLRLMFEMRVPLHAAAVSCGRRRLDVVLHERVVLQRICILVCFFADLRVVLLGNLDEFHTRVVRLRADTNGDESKEQGADAGNPRDDFLFATQLLSLLPKDWNHAQCCCDTSYRSHCRLCPCPHIRRSWLRYGSAGSCHSRCPDRDPRS